MENQTTSQFPQTPSEPIVKPVETKGKVNPMMIIFILFTLILAGVSAFLGYKNMQLTKQIASLKISPTLVATTDPTAAWVSYTSADNKFSFKAPQNLDVIETNKTISIGANIKNDLISADTLNISYNNDGTTPVGYSGTAAGDPIDDGFVQFMGITIPKVKLVFQGKTTDVYYGGGPGSTNLIKIGQSQFIISTVWGLASKDGMPKTTEDLFDQILSTFKFTN